MWEWITSNAAVMQAIIALVTAGVWITYLHVFVESLRRQRRSEILITMGGMIIGEELIKVIWGPQQIPLPLPEALRLSDALAGSLRARVGADADDVPVVMLSPGEVKKFATGKGNADKAAMIAAARARGFSPADDNEADAIAILHWAIETNGGVA